MILLSEFKSFEIPLIDEKKIYLIFITPWLDYIRNIINFNYIIVSKSLISRSKSRKNCLQINESKIHVYYSNNFVEKIYIS